MISTPSAAADAGPSRSVAGGWPLQTGTAQGAVGNIPSRTGCQARSLHRRVLREVLRLPPVAGGEPSSSPLWLLPTWG